MAKTLKIRFIPNPLSPEGRTCREVEIDPSDFSLLHYLPAEYQTGDFKVILDSRGEVASEDWAACQIRPECDELLIAACIEDPVSIGAAIWAGASAAATWAAANWLTILSLGVTIGSTALSFMTSKKPALSGGTDATSSSPTYGWDGIRTMCDVDTSLAIIFGQVFTGGNIVNMYVENRSGKSYLHVLIAVGWGPLTEICGVAEDTDGADLDQIGDKLKIDGNPVSDYDGVKVAVRMGRNDQEPIAGFGWLHQMTSLSDELAKDDPYVIDTMIGRPVDAVQINVRIPCLYKAGLSYEGASATLKIEYRKKDAPLDDYTDYGTWTISGKYFSAVRRSRRIDLPSRDEYKIRLTQTSGNSNDKYQRSVFIVGLDEIVKEERCYPNTALLGMEIEASDQLSGSIDSVVMFVKGLAFDVWDEAGAKWVKQFTRNPVWCLLGALRNPYWGVAKFIEPTHLNLDRFKIEAPYCDELVDVGGGVLEPRFCLDMAIDTKMAVPDAFEKMAAVCNGILYWSSSAVQPRIDRPGVAELMFGEGSIRDPKIEYKSGRKTKNIVEIQFPNALLEGQRDTVQAVDRASIVAGEPERVKTVFLPGITRRSQAIAVATYMLGVEKYCTRAMSLETGMKGAFVQAGGLIEVSTRMAGWGLLSGRVTGAGNDAAQGWLTLNRDLAIPEGAGCRVRVAYNADGSRVEKTLALAAGTYAAGSRIAIEGVWERVPEAFDEFAVGPPSQIVQPFRIVSTKRQNDGRVNITALSYDERVYDPVDVVIEDKTVTTLPDPRRIPKGVTQLTAYRSSDGDARIVVAWENSVDDTGLADDLVDHYEVWSSLDGEVFALDGMSSGDAYVKANIVPGAHWWFKVIAVSRLNRKSSLDAAETVDIHAQTAQPPANVEGLELFGQGHGTEFTGRDAKFTWRNTSYATGTDLLGEATGLGAGAGSLDRFFQDWRVEIWADGVCVRTEFPAANEYVYTHEKNAEDQISHETDANGLESQAKRTFTIKVWARDIFNQTSQIPAQLTVSNPRADAPNGVLARASYGTFFVEWDGVAGTDIEGYQVRKGLAADFAWEDGEIVYEGASTSFSMPRAEVDPVVSTYRFRVGCFDTFGKDGLNYSGVVSATSASVPMSDVEKAPLELSQMFTNIPVPDAPNWASNSPTAGSVSWLGHRLFYQGVEVAIAAGSTSRKFIYWSKSNPSVYQASDAHPVQAGDDGFILATNTGGAVSVAIGVIANQLIGSAYIMDAAITTVKVNDAAITTAKIGDAQITSAKVNDLAADKITAGDIAAARMTVHAADALNGGATLIEPGRIKIAGTATLADWRNGTDATRIEGGSIAANTIKANAIEIGARGVLVDGVLFHQDETTANLLRWTAGNITYSNDAGSPVVTPVNAGNRVWTSGTLYLYWPKSANDLAATADRAVAFGSEAFPLAAYKGGNLIDTGTGKTQVTGDVIRTGSITSTNIAAGAITAEKLDAGAVTADKIAAGAITADKIEVGSRRITFENVTFQFNAQKKLIWTAGSVHYMDDSGALQSEGVSAGDGQWTSGKLYATWKPRSGAFETTTNIATALLPDRAIVMIYDGASLSNPWYGKTIVDGQDIYTGSITANQIAAGAITASQIAANAVTADKIQADAITASKIAVTDLSAISAALGSVTSGTITLSVGTINRLRIDSQGIYVSHDSGGSWRKFLAMDGSGKLAISFDAFADDSEVAGLKVKGPTGWTDETVQDGIAVSASWSSWRQLFRENAYGNAIAEAVEHPSQKVRFVADLIPNGGVGVAWALAEVGLFETQDAETPLYSAAVSMTYDSSAGDLPAIVSIMSPFEDAGLAVGASFTMKFRAKYTYTTIQNPDLGVRVKAKVNTIGYAGEVFKKA